ncbi:pyridoxamine 5'-phosphate oxidase family protein [Sediminibacterium soli]|uniref:pyridoxamine 5'-phosphate oxidase family protein n=1 Tax=Sediminibacterium soli TaxID=2698829 RepID=UPI0013799C3E|nr:pyridoxamine 5'-phosphate oxidase family protein [Sediminibacterium soli]NCI45675.1 pyridoxamine 5'-phosphate oxidase family protein [Sediminibacterium soli]
MTGLLGPQQIESLLSGQLIGRIACSDNNVPYISPISYAYDGKDLYFHTSEGKKTEIMRRNPRVCFQTDHMHSMGEWESVIVWGNYEELTEPAGREAALKLLVARTLPLISSVTTHLGRHWPFIQENLNEEIPGIVFRIKVTEKTGRFENSMHSPCFAV